MVPFIPAGGMLLKALLAGGLATYLHKNEKIPNIFDVYRDQEKNFLRRNEDIVRTYVANGVEVPEAFAPTLERIQAEDKKLQEVKSTEEANKEKVQELLFKSLSKKPDPSYGPDNRLDELVKAKAAFDEQRKLEKNAYDMKLARIMNNYDFGLLTTKERDDAIRALKTGQSEFNASDYFKNELADRSTLGPGLFLPNLPK